MNSSYPSGMPLVSLNQTIYTGIHGAHSNDTAEGIEPDAKCKSFVFIIYVPIFGIICLFGLLGNSLSFIVLQWEKKNRVATFLLQSLALADNLFLLTTGFAQIFLAVCLYYGLDAYRSALPYIRVLLWPLVHITQFGTIWMTVLIAANRYIAICRPFQTHKLCTMTKVRIQVISLIIFSVLYNLTHFFEYNLTHDLNAETEMKQNSVYNVVYENALYCLFVFLGPLVILIILNVCLIKELWAARMRLIARQITMAGEEEEQNITLVMIVIMLIFVICQTPAFINQLLFYCLDPRTNYQCGRPYYYFYHLSNLLVSANSSTNFIVYCVFRQQFRERLYAFCNRKHTALKHLNTYSHNGRSAAVYSKDCKCDPV